MHLPRRSVYVLTTEARYKPGWKHGARREAWRPVHGRRRAAVVGRAGRSPQTLPHIQKPRLFAAGIKPLGSCGVARNHNPSWNPQGLRRSLTTRSSRPYAQAWAACMQGLRETAHVCCGATNMKLACPGGGGCCVLGTALVRSDLAPLPNYAGGAKAGGGGLPAGAAARGAAGEGPAHGRRACLACLGCRACEVDAPCPYDALLPVALHAGICRRGRSGRRTSRMMWRPAGF